jgi:hypothetical protein
MPHVKLYKQSPVLRKYACGTSKLHHPNEGIDGLQLPSRPHLDRLHDLPLALSSQLWECLLHTGH